MMIIWVANRIFHSHSWKHVTEQSLITHVLQLLDTQTQGKSCQAVDNSSMSMLQNAVKIPIGHYNTIKTYTCQHKTGKLHVFILLLLILSMTSGFLYVRKRSLYDCVLFRIFLWPCKCVWWTPSCLLHPTHRLTVMNPAASFGCTGTSARELL